MIRTTHLIVAMAVIMAGAFTAAYTQGADVNMEKETDPLVLENLEKFQDLKFGLFIHWAPCSQWGQDVSWPISKTAHWARPDDFPAWVERGKDYDLFVKDYFDLNKTFNPVQFDPDAWAQAAAYAGMKYIVLTTKHHDGFAMFDTKYSHYKITDPSCPFHSNPQADITRVVFDAFRKRGIRTSVYFSLPDWYHPDYEDPTLPPVKSFVTNYDIKEHPEKWQRFVEFTHGQIEELMTHYGPIDILWFDGGNTEYDWGMEKMAEMARRLQPGLLIVHRGAGGRYENYHTPEQQIPDKALPYAWETCMSMGDYWAYNPRDYYKPARELIHLIAEINCKGGNLLLDIGPDAQGRLPEESIKRLKELGDWMKFNGEAIYDTRPVAPYAEGQFRLTRKGDAVYLIYLSKLGQVRAPYVSTISCIRPAEGAKVTLLGREDVPLTWENHGEQGMLIRVPLEISCPLRGEYPYCRHAWTFKVSKAIVHSESEK